MENDFAEFMNKPCIVELAGDALALIAQGQLPIPLMNDRSVTIDGQQYTQTEFKPLPYVAGVITDQKEGGIVVQHTVLSFGDSGEARAPVKMKSWLNIERVKSISVLESQPSSLVVP